MTEENMAKQLDRIRKAYDVTVEEYNNEIDPLDTIPEEIKNSDDFKAFLEYMTQMGSALSIDAPEIKSYLDPRIGMRFLDAGCSANLANYRLDRWHSTFYGIDLSPALIRTMVDFVAQEDISIGGLYVTDLSKLPFEDNFFDIAAVIGVLEYCTLEYIKNSLLELNRVLKAQAKVVLDIPNHKHPHYRDMLMLEEHLGRPNIPFSKSAFEKIMEPLFSIERVDDSHLMIRYFVQTIK